MEEKMTDLMEIIKNRRSIRKYEDKEVPEDALIKIFEAAQWAPSWTNCQCWDIVVVKAPETKIKLQETVVAVNPAKKAIVAAPIVLAVCGKKGVSGFYDKKASTKFGEWQLFDLGIATQNICLTAHSLGLGTVIVGLFDHDKAKAVLHVPESHELVALIPLGYPAKNFQSTEAQRN
jgi:nitroreductase